MHADIHVLMILRINCIFNDSKLARERNQETPSMKCLPCNRRFLVREGRALADVVIPIKRNKGNLLNLLIPLVIMTNSNNCIQNKHDSCDGVVKTLIDDSDNTKMCTCQCHNSSYQMVQKMFGVINQKE